MVSFAWFSFKAALSSALLPALWEEEAIAGAAFWPLGFTLEQIALACRAPLRARRSSWARLHHPSPRGHHIRKLVASWPGMRTHWTFPVYFSMPLLTSLKNHQHAKCNNSLKKCHPAVQVKPCMHATMKAPCYVHSHPCVGCTNFFKSTSFERLFSLLSLLWWPEELHNKALTL